LRPHLASLEASREFVEQSDQCVAVKGAMHGGRPPCGRGPSDRVTRHGE
jgi:predicted PP-loop superfamily ATPase